VRPGRRLPRRQPRSCLIWSLVDELSDLMMISAREVEDSCAWLRWPVLRDSLDCRDQRPSVDVLTGVIKANFPARLSFQVTSKVDSRTILDTNGAETLLGQTICSFWRGTSKPQRVRCVCVEAEISRLVEAESGQQTRYDDGLAPRRPCEC
jgi:S-DNA-T family DNA segregation ATPase FtsK/SpoIIIE